MPTFYPVTYPQQSSRLMCRTYGRKHARIEYAGLKREANLAKERKEGELKKNGKKAIKKTPQAKKTKNNKTPEKTTGIKNDKKR